MVLPIKFNPATKTEVLEKIQSDEIADGIADKFFHFTQSVLAVTWIIPHGFGRVPNITVFEEDGKEILISPNHILESDGITCNTSIINFDTLLIGKVICT